MLEPIVIQSPSPSNSLILLFHGVGSTPQNMIPLGRRLAGALPRATVISVPSADPCDMGSGYQWFSVRGITETNRAPRVAEAMPRFVATIAALQRMHGMTASRTVLIGFSQGGIMSLESSLLAAAPAGRVASLAGRFVQLPQQAPASTVLHLLHGERDQVIDPQYSTAAARQLEQLGAAFTLDMIPELGHGIDAELADRLVARLSVEPLPPA